jgi:hypothetical protein
MTRLTKIPMIAAFSAVIAAFAITTEASADRGDARGHQQYNGNHRGGDHHRASPQYRGGAHAAPNRAYNPGARYNGNRQAYNRNYHSGNRSYNRPHTTNRYVGNAHNDRRWSDNRRWDNNRYRDNRRWDNRHYHPSRPYYSGYHGHARPHYRGGYAYDYHRPYTDRDYYWRHRSHYSSWRPYYGPVWGGYRSAYWRDRGCVPVTRYWTWDGRPALVGGIQCYDPRGAAFGVSDNYFLLNYY